VEPLDLTVELEDGAGRKAAVALSEIMPLMPPFRATFTRLERLEGHYRAASEPVLQSFHIPLARFLRVEPGLDTGRLRAVRFRFDRSEKGLVFLDEVGFRYRRP